MADEQELGGLKPEDLAKLKPLKVAQGYASSFRVQGTGNDFTLICMRSTPVQAEDGSINPDIGVLEPVFVVTLSPQGMKDLALLASSQVERHEKDFGEIVTPYTKLLKEQKPT